MLAPGTVVSDRYRLIALLGEGGMGSVWSAVDGEDGREVALKFVKDVDARVDRRRRFSREARAAMSLDHPNVVRIHEVIAGDDGATPPFMVMDLLRGESLAARLGRVRRLSLPAFSAIFVQILSAVGAAHARGIVHRDLKPGNIFILDAGDEVRVLDFGIAKFAEQDLATASTNLTSTGDILGTPQYMSPEQIFGERDLDHRADLWALGMIAFECLAGRHPIAAENIGQVLKAITTSTLPTLDDAVPAPVRDVVARMMRRERDARPADLHEVLAVFAPYTTVVVPAFGPPAIVPASSDRASTARAPSLQASPRGDSIDAATAAPRSPQRSLRTPLLAVSGLAIAVVASAAMLSRNRATVGAPTPIEAPKPLVTSASVAPPPAPVATPSSAPTANASSAPAASASTMVKSPIAPAVRPTPKPPPTTAPASKKSTHDEDI